MPLLSSLENLVNPRLHELVGLLPKEDQQWLKVDLEDSGLKKRPDEIVLQAIADYLSVLKSNIDSYDKRGVDKNASAPKSLLQHLPEDILANDTPTNLGEVLGLAKEQQSRVNAKLKATSALVAAEKEAVVATVASILDNSAIQMAILERRAENLEQAGKRFVLTGRS